MQQQITRASSITAGQLAGLFPDRLNLRLSGGMGNGDLGDLWQPAYWEGVKRMG